MTQPLKVIGITVFLAGSLVLGAQFIDRAFAPSCSAKIEDRSVPNKTIEIYISSGQSPSGCLIGPMVQAALGWDDAQAAAWTGPLPTYLELRGVGGPSDVPQCKDGDTIVIDPEGTLACNPGLVEEQGE